jgi:hypothetical protein
MRLSRAIAVPSLSRTRSTMLTRGVGLVVLLAAVSGCATREYAPSPTGGMWAFFTDTDLALGPRAVIYTTSPVACETERRRRNELNAACVPVVVARPGTDYYAISLPSNVDPNLPAGVTFGTIDRDRCERLRMTLFRAYSGALGDCERVAVRRAP